MKLLRNTTIALAALLIFTASVDAQRRPARRTTPPKPVATSTAASAVVLKAASEKVSIQIKNTTKFLFLLGGVAKGIEDLDKDRNANKAARDANAENKRALIKSIQNLRAGILALEVEFRTKEPLKKHLLLVQGIADLTAQSENLAAAGRFGDSGKPLLTLVEKLSDVLAAM